MQNLVQKVKFAGKFECPFDIEKTFELTVNTDNLKGVLNWIIEHLGTLKVDMGELETKVTTKLMQVDKNKEGVAKNSDEIEKLKAICKQLENKTIEQDNKTSELNASVESMGMNMELKHREAMEGLEDHKELLDKHTKEIEELQKKIAGLAVGGGAEIDMNAMDERYALKGEPDLTISRLEELEVMNEMLLNRIIKHEKSLYENSTLEQLGSNQEIKSKIHEAVKKDRVASPQRREKEASGINVESELDKIMAELDKLNETDQDITKRVQILEKGMGAANTQLKDHEADINALKNAKPIEFSGGDVDTSAIFQKIAQVESALNSHKSDTASQHEKIWARLDGLDNLRHELERLRAEFEMHKGKDFKDLEARVSALEKQLRKVLEKLENMPVGESGFDEGRMRQLEARVDALEAALDGLKNEFARWIKELQDQINAKPSWEKIELYINARFDEIVKAMSKQFAGKDETRKALKMHEKQLQNLYNLIMQRCGGGNENEEDAMFSKKPLGGLSCASCEKGLVDMYGKKVEFMPWQKLPFRDPAERIARVGQGFSKMLSMLNPDQLSRYEQGSKMAAYQQQQMHNSQHDPNVNNGEFYDQG